MVLDMISIKRHLFLLVIGFSSILFMSGCSSNTLSEEIPSWYLNTPNNNAGYLYGSGQGKTLTESKSLALNNLASQLSVNISSIINNYKSASTNENGTSLYSKNVSQDVQVEVENMRFANVKVEKITQIGESFFTLVKVSRTKLFEENYKEFESLDISINTTVQRIATKPILEKIQALQNLYPKLTQAKKEAFILYTIQNNFNYSSYITKYDSTIGKIQTLKDKILINLSTNEKSKFFSNELLKLLNENRYKVSPNNTDTQIKLTNNIRYSTAKGWQIAKVTTNISTLSQGKTVSNTTISSVGRSTSSKENAKASAAQHFKKELYKLGLDTILFSQ